MRKFVVETWQDLNNQASEYLKKDEHVAEFVIAILVAIYGVSEVAYEAGGWFGQLLGSVM